MTVIRSKTPQYWFLKAVPVFMFLIVLVSLYNYAIWFDRINVVFKVLMPIFILFFGYIGVAILLKNRYV